MLYEYFKEMQDMADDIGKVTALHMEDEWLPGMKRVSIEGTTKAGEPFVLNLEVGTHGGSES